MNTSRLDPRLTAVCVMGFCAFLNLYAPQSLLPTFVQAFHVSKAMASLTVSATTLAIALFSPLAGSLLGRFGRHQLLRPALALLGTAAVLSAFAGSLSTLLLMRFLEGAAVPVLLAVAMAFIGQEWSGSGVGRVMAIYVAANVLGGFCGRFLSGLMAEALGWRAALLLVGLLNVGSAWAVLNTMPDGRPRATSSLSWAPVRRLWQQPAIRAACLIGFCVLFALAGSFTYVTYHLAEAPFHLGPCALGSIFFVYLLGGAVTPLAGRGLDRVGFPVGLTIAALVVAGGALCTLAPSLAWCLLGLTVICSGAFVSQSAATGFVAQAAGADRGTAIGMYLSCYYLGGTAGAAVPGLFWAVGGWSACVLAVVAAEAVVLWQARRLA